MPIQLLLWATSPHNHKMVNTKPVAFLHGSSVSDPNWKGLHRAPVAQEGASGKSMRHGFATLANNWNNKNNAVSIACPTEYGKRTDYW